MQIENVQRIKWRFQSYEKYRFIKLLVQNALFVCIFLVTISNSKHFPGRREKVHLVYKTLKQFTRLRTVELKLFLYACENKEHSSDNFFSLLPYHQHFVIRNQCCSNLVVTIRKIRKYILKITRYILPGLNILIVFITFVIVKLIWTVVIITKYSIVGRSSILRLCRSSTSTPKNKTICWNTN